MRVICATNGHSVLLALPLTRTTARNITFVSRTTKEDSQLSTWNVQCAHSGTTASWPVSRRGLISTTAYAQAIKPSPCLIPHQVRCVVFIVFVWCHNHCNKHHHHYVSGRVSSGNDDRANIAVLHKSADICCCFVCFANYNYDHETCVVFPLP